MVGNLRVFIADDDERNRATVLRELGVALEVRCKRDNVTFEQCGDFHEALRVLNSRSGDFDFVVVDILWPPYGDQTADVEDHEPRGPELIQVAKDASERPIVLGISQGSQPIGRDFRALAEKAGADLFRYWGDLGASGAWFALADDICAAVEARGEATKVDGNKLAQSSVNENERRRTVFVVHGRSDVRQHFVSFAESLGLSVLEFEIAKRRTQRRLGRNTVYVGEILDTAFNEAQAIVVLFTPDDEARLKTGFRAPDEPTHELKLTGQARANVIFEAGMAVGRKPERVVLLEFGSLRAFSDVGGLHMLRMSNSAADRRQLRSELENAGCLTNPESVRWQEVGDFEEFGPA